MQDSLTLHDGANRWSRNVRFKQPHGRQLDPSRWDQYVVPKRRFQTILRRLVTHKTKELGSTVAEAYDLPYYPYVSNTLWRSYCTHTAWDLLFTAEPWNCRHLPGPALHCTRPGDHWIWRDKRFHNTIFRGTVMFSGRQVHLTCPTLITFCGDTLKQGVHHRA
jgi:hypothetical protein